MKRKLLVVSTLILFVGRLAAQIESADSVRYEGEKEIAFKLADLCIEYGGGGVGYATRVYTVTTINGVEDIDDTTGVAGAFIYPIQVEYGFRDWFGFGGRFAYSYLLNEKDAVTGNMPKGRALDFNLVFNFHLIKKEHFEMPITALWGFSNYKKRHFNNINQIDKGNGISGGLLFTPKYYINSHMGVYLNLGVLNFVYADLDVQDNLSSKKNSTVSFGGSGGTLGLGAAWKF